MVCALQAELQPAIFRICPVPILAIVQEISKSVKTAAELNQPRRYFLNSYSVTFAHYGTVSAADRMEHVILRLPFLEILASP